ncbi:DUF5696 domain-containing protein [Chthonomonas calidirosea]|uniref:DUF5696 domain-containing protein n=1 Tax=Chthonomonas calidirosea TaxID=454171 RepID=UPI0006EC77AE|nr:DUF5696 domain-containing protein [Chthonomonas calidirosea]CEK15878.1 Glycosyl hydrolases related to GH101 family, GHL1-GHL3 [Chthonomonas calidirosea]
MWHLGRAIAFCFLLLCPCLLSAQPPSVPADLVVSLPTGTTSLDEIGLYQVSYRYDDGHSGTMPIGWSGFFTEDTGIACEPFGDQNGKKAFLLHPIWRGGTGDTDQTFWLRLPRAKRILLRFSIAMRQGFTGPHLSDGATFRLFINGQKKLDENKTDSTWTSYQFDLTPYAGQIVTLRFETDPGPKRDPSFDYALWGDREILVTGGAAPSPPTFHPDPASLLLRRTTFGSCSPTYTPQSRYRLQAEVTSHPKTLFDGWSLVLSPRADSHARLMPPIFVGFGATITFVTTDGQLVRSDSPQVRLLSLTQHTDPATHSVVRNAIYAVGDRKVRLQAVLSAPSGHAVRLDLRSPDPYIAAVDFGRLGPVAFVRRIVVPYLGTVDYFPQLGLYANTIGDFVLSHASSFDGTTAIYGPLTNGQRNALQETVYYALSNNLRDVLPTPPNPPSPYLKLMGQFVVLDVWGGRFTDNAAWLRELATYDLTHLLTIVHVWQHGGYDNQLPDTVPANADLGGDEGMKVWTHTAESLGERIALHENYVDFYPNAPSFTWNDVARDSQGNPQPAWKNIIQSYALAPTAILKYAKPITTLVQQHYAPNASYLDVHSSVPPWWHVDFQAGRPGAGEFHTVWEAYKALWQLFRQVHHGPVLGEGNQHWRWSGLLDGVEAQFGQGVPTNGGEEAPLFVDFDLLKIHPLQCNHGMGYLERWLPQGYEGFWWQRVPPTKTLDQYRMEEIAYGHDGFIPSQLVRNLAYIWQEENLLWPITSRYSTALPQQIRYEVDGKLVATEQAIAAHSRFDRVFVAYNNGLLIYANARDSDWPLAVGRQRIVLPQYGWLVLGKDIIAWTARRQGVVADYLRTPNRIYVNARTDVAGLIPPLAVQPSVLSFQQTGPRAFRIAFAWQVGAPIPQGDLVFVHITQPGLEEHEGIRLQPDSGIATPPDRWPLGTVEGSPVAITLPPDLKDGDYQIKLGIFSPQTGERLHLRGDDDGSSRIIVGTLHVADDGGVITLTKDTKTSAVPQALLEAHQNVKAVAISFGPVRTNGSLRLKRQKAGQWVLIPFPRDKAFDVTLVLSDIDPLWRQGVRITALNTAGAPIGRIPVQLRAHNGALQATFRVNTVPNAVAYLLVAAPSKP